MSAASPGVTALFFPNQFYASDEEYVFALAEGLRHEYETIAAAGSCCRSIAPTWPWAATCSSPTSPRGVPQAHRHEHRRAQPRAAQHPGRAAADAPVLGQLPGPHHCDVPLGEIADIVWSAKPQTVLLEGANPRHAHEFAFFEDHPLPEGKILCPGMIEPQSPISNIPS
jgi:5-methyltetrahydropteroyltriglutamate--homocysteine methyltransferase